MKIITKFNLLIVVFFKVKLKIIIRQQIIIIGDFEFSITKFNIVLSNPALPGIKYDIKANRIKIEIANNVVFNFFKQHKFTSKYDKHVTKIIGNAIVDFEINTTEIPITDIISGKYIFLLLINGININNIDITLTIDDP